MQSATSSRKTTTSMKWNIPVAGAHPRTGQTRCANLMRHATHICDMRYEMSADVRECAWRVDFFGNHSRPSAPRPLIAYINRVRRTDRHQSAVCYHHIHISQTTTEPPSTPNHQHEVHRCCSAAGRRGKSHKSEPSTRRPTTTLRSDAARLFRIANHITCALCSLFRRRHRRSPPRPSGRSRRRRTS